MSEAPCAACRPGQNALVKRVKAQHDGRAAEVTCACSIAAKCPRIGSDGSAARTAAAKSACRK